MIPRPAAPRRNSRYPVMRRVARPSARSVFLAAVIAVLTAGPVLAAAPDGSAAPEGTAAPAPRIVPAAEFDLADYAGRVVVLDFWASWCKPCRKSIPWLSQLQERHGPQGLTVVAVNLDKDIAAAADQLKELGTQVVVVADPAGKLAEQYELQGMPSSFHVDRQGRIAGRHVGFLPEEGPAREAEIVKLLESGEK